GGSAWYRYTANDDGGVFADTFGSTYALYLGVFAGDSLGALQPIGCNNSPTGNAQVGFGAKRGTTYYFQIVGPVAGGDLVFELSPVRTLTRANLSSQGDQDDVPAY